MHVELLYYGLCVLVSAVVFLCVGFWYVRPRMDASPLPQALIPLLLFSGFRVNGLFFIVAGIAAPDIPMGFALPTAIGDAASACIAVIAAIALHRGSSFGVPLAWTYNVLGSLDLVVALSSVAIYGVLPRQFGATWVLPTINVPALVVAHMLMLSTLARRKR